MLNIKFIREVTDKKGFVRKKFVEECDCPGVSMWIEDRTGGRWSLGQRGVPGGICAACGGAISNIGESGSYGI